MAESVTTRVALVGAGPAGVAVACQLARRGIPYLHFEKGELGATVAWFPRQMLFHTPVDEMKIDGVALETSIPGGATREDYLAYLRKVVATRGLEVRTGEEVLELSPADGRFRLRTRGPRGETEVDAERVVLAVGHAAAPRRLDVPGEDLPHVSHYFEGPDGLEGKRVLVIGGRISALESTQRAFAAGARVALSYRGAAFQLRTEVGRSDARRVLGLAVDRRIELWLETQPVRFEPGLAWLRHADGSQREVAADRVFALVGYEPDLRLLARAGGSAERPVRDWRTLESDVPGVYLAGAASGPYAFDPRLISASADHALRIAAHVAGEPVPPAEPPRWARGRRPRDAAAAAQRIPERRPEPALRRLRRAARAALDALRG